MWRAKDGGWAEPRNLGADEHERERSPRREFFLFSSARQVPPLAAGERPNQPQNGLRDIYWKDLSALHELVK